MDNQLKLGMLDILNKIKPTNWKGVVEFQLLATGPVVFSTLM
jgi:hypothetical protein